MELLKYLGIPRVLEVFGDKTPKRYTLDAYSKVEEVYPVGTERIVEKYFLFPKNINGTKVRGSQKVRQVCQSNTLEVNAGKIKSESWKDLEIIIAEN